MALFRATLLAGLIIFAWERSPARARGSNADAVDGAACRPGGPGAARGWSRSKLPTKRGVAGSWIGVDFEVATSH